MNVAVVGGGVFGSMAALQLAGQGHDVTLCERQPGLMQGASYNNQNRLHLGFHYPRDDQTAGQCRRGFTRFLAEFAPCVLGNFPNAYFIAREGSLTTPADFLGFCARQQLSYRPVDVRRFRPLVRGVELGVLTDEVVYDSALLRGLIARRLELSGVKLLFGRSIAGIRRRGPHRFELELDGRERLRFDGVVNCSYAAINALTSQLGHRVEARQYEYTAVAVIELDWPAPTGITILDGA